MIEVEEKKADAEMGEKKAEETNEVKTTEISEIRTE